MVKEAKKKAAKEFAMKKEAEAKNKKWSLMIVNRLKFLFLPIFVLIFPVLLVVMQPDLGTSILIAGGGLGKGGLNITGGS